MNKPQNYIKRKSSNKEAIKRVLWTVVILLTTTIGVCGCIRNKEISTNDVDTYLEDKYGNDFTYISNGNDTWAATTTTYKYSDPEKNVFQVQVTGEYIADNYSSVLFDSEIQKYINSNIKTRCKVYASTEGEFLGKSGKFNNCNEYLRKGAVISLVIYSTDKEVKDQLSDELSELLPNSTLNVVLKTVSEEIYSEKSLADSDHTEYSDIISSDSFQIKKLS